MKKKIFIVTSVVLVIVLVGVLGIRFCVNYFFDKYFLGSALSSAIGSAQSEENYEGNNLQEIPEQQKNETDETQAPETDIQETVKPEEKPKKKLSNTEVINRVLKSSELTNKMASMVPYEDKRAVLKIVLSNFSESELTEIAKNVSKGLTPAYKSKMISLARSRLTGAQWNQCLNIAYKYVDAIRPYVE